MSIFLKLFFIFSLFLISYGWEVDEDGNELDPSSPEFQRVNAAITDHLNSQLAGTQFLKPVNYQKTSSLDIWFGATISHKAIFDYGETNCLKSDSNIDSNLCKPTRIVNTCFADVREHVASPKLEVVDFKCQ